MGTSDSQQDSVDHVLNACWTHDAVLLKRLIQLCKELLDWGLMGRGAQQTELGCCLRQDSQFLRLPGPPLEQLLAWRWTRAAEEEDFMAEFVDHG